MPKDILTFIVAGVVIHQDGKYFLVQEKLPKAYGLWNWPAGHVEEGQTIEAAAIRETKEESGFDVELIKKIGVFQSHAGTPPKHAFEAKIIGGEVLKYPTDELLDGRWYTADEIRLMKDKLRSEWILPCVELLEKKN